jgi:hypothetical protein
MIENPLREKRYFVDTEYVWLPNEGRIEPLSIGVVGEDGREFYRQNQNCYPDSDFVRQHVWDKMDNLDWWHHRDGDTFPWTTIPDMRRDLLVFIGDDTPQFWGDYAAFDYVVLSMLMGAFEDWPEHWPMHINDFQQDAIPSMQSEIPHHALSDARAMRDAWDHAFSGELA